MRNGFRDISTQIAQMGALRDQARVRLLEGVSKERFKMQSCLILQLDNSMSNHVKCSAAFLLGVYRMEESVRSLARFITLTDQDQPQQHREPLWGSRPVVEALIRIGRPAIPAMTENIQESTDPLAREYSARVIKYIEGKEIAEIIVQRAIRAQKAAQKRKKLEAAVQYIRNMPE